MTLGDKIKQALHLEKGDKNAAGKATFDSSEPQTGSEAYKPLTHNAEGASATSGSQTGRPQDSATHAAAKSTSPHAASGTAGTGSRTGGVGSGTTGTGTGTGSSTAGGQQGSGVFKQGYSEDAPGYDTTYKQGDPLYTESIQTSKAGDGKWSAELQAESDSRDWERAKELTDAAEHESASAQLAGQKAGKELAAAEKAEQAVRKAQQKYREALEEAEKQRGIISSTSLAENELEDAQELLRRKQAAAEEAGRGVREAEADLAARKRDLDGLHPQVEKYGQTLPGLEQDYASQHEKREAAEAEKDRLLLAAREAEQARAGHAADLEALEAELEAAEKRAAIKQQEYIDARNQAQAAAEKADALRNKLRSLDQALLAHRGRAQEAEETLPAYKEAEDRALRDLESSKAEWYHLRELEDEYARNFQLANDRLKGLQGSSGPADRELQKAQSLLGARQDDLDGARSRARKAEGKYKELLALADRHKQYGDSAANAAQTHGQKYEALKQEAAIHGDKHVQLWNEAKTYGEHGSSTATDAVHKLEEKVKTLMASHKEP